MEAFRCKQFSVIQDGVAMKVNTDGMLLGAWASLPASPSARLIDIGTGSGIIALMLAQRCASLHAVQHTESAWKIDALEPHEPSAAVAAQNFKNAPWAAHCCLFPLSLQAYLQEQQDALLSYDCIVSNPPYFHNALRPPSAERQLVRHTDTLSHLELIQGVSSLLKDSGSFAVVLPYAEQEAFCRAARLQGLFLCRQTRVYTREGRPAKRILMEFAKKEEPLQSDSLYIYDADGALTAPYIQLTKDFYLFFPSGPFAPSGD